MNSSRRCAYLELSTVPEIFRLSHRFVQITKDEGFQKAVSYASRKIFGLGKPVKKNSIALPGECLELNPGDLVRVRPEDAIRSTLDGKDKTKGLLFMPEMWKFCGGIYVVYKRVNTVLVESTGKKRNLKNTVLLTDVHCDGSAHSNCDSSCFHFWREAWLEKVESE